MAGCGRKYDGQRPPSSAVRRVAGGIQSRAGSRRSRSYRMKKHVGLVMLLGLIAMPLLAVAGRPAGKEPIEERLLAFSLKDLGGRDVALADFKDKKAVVVVFTGTECPVNNYYML